MHTFCSFDLNQLLSVCRYREAFRVLAEKESSLLLKVRDQAAALATSEESSRCALYRCSISVLV